MEEQSIVKQLTNILRRIAALPEHQHPTPDWITVGAPDQQKQVLRCFTELSRLPGESAADYRVRALDVIGSWWGRSGATVRSMEEGHRDGSGSTQFCRDLRTYGGVRFKTVKGADGQPDRDVAIVKASLNTGMETIDYLATKQPRRRPPARRTAAKKRRTSMY